MKRIPRTDRRYIRRLRTRFFAEGFPPRTGFSSDLSETGLFIRTNHALDRGSHLDMILHLPDGTECNLRGEVMRATKTDAPHLVKNGMGVKLTSVCSNYLAFLRELDDVRSDEGGGGDTAAKPAIMEESTEVKVMVACTNCGAKNRIPRSKLDRGPKCGKCKVRLSV